VDGYDTILILINLFIKQNDWRGRKWREKMREIIEWNEKWAFSKEAEQIPDQMPENWYWVNLPHTWNAIDGQDGGNDYYRGTCYYAKKLDTAMLPEGKRYYLEFAGTNSSASVYLNGKEIGHHDGGYSTWRVELSELREGENLIVVAVDNSANEHVYPQNADFTFYGGIYRVVKIIAVEDSHFELEKDGTSGLLVTPELEGADATVVIKTEVRHAKENQSLRYSIQEQDGTTVLAKTLPIEETTARLSLKGIHLWNGKKDPYLYTAEVQLLYGEEVIDSVSARFGCRTFEIDPNRGFILNGKPYPLRGVSRHQDRWGVGNALLPEHHREDMELIDEMGANTIRLAHYQHDAYFYDLCDEYGMVVWAEIPYISTHMPGARENTISQMRELVIQNYNHPSIVVWGLSNEITMGGDSTEDLLENHRILNDLVHELDKTRQTAVAVVSMCDPKDPYIQIPDVVSYNHYFGWYGGDVSMNGPWFDRFHKEFLNIPIGVSEYGCEALNWHTSDPRQGDYTEEYQAYYHEEMIKQLFSRPYLWTTHVWNMFDFGADARNEGGENGQNHKGLVTFDRKYKKDAFYAYKAWLSKEPFVHICGKRYVDRIEEVTKITVYSNQPEVELFVNGESIGRKTEPEHFFYFEVKNEGETKIRAVAGECVDESKIRKVSEPNEDYILKEKGAILNWFDVTAPEGYFSLQDKVEDILKSEEGKQLFEAWMKQMQSSVETPVTLSDKILQMIGGFTVLRMVNMLGLMADMKKEDQPVITKEMLLSMNEHLNQIKKPEIG
jgi:beta-galactosidase